MAAIDAAELASPYAGDLAKQVIGSGPRRAAEVQFLPWIYPDERVAPQRTISDPVAAPQVDRDLTAWILSPAMVGAERGAGLPN